MENEFLRMISSNHYLVDFIVNVDVRNYIACQFALESGFGSSEIANKYCNYCGMKVPHRRYSSRVGATTENHFCIYNSFDDCVKDYLLWIFYNRPFQNVFDSIGNYKIFLRDSGYCPEKIYLSLIDKIYNQFFNLKN